MLLTNSSDSQATLKAFKTQDKESDGVDKQWPRDVRCLLRGKRLGGGA